MERLHADGARHAMKRQSSRSRRRPVGEKDLPRAASAAEEVARTADERVLTEAEKATLAAEVSRIEDA
jgi:hypothetical protein